TASVFMLPGTTAFGQHPVDLPPHSQMVESHPFYTKPIPALKDTTLNGVGFDIDNYKDQIIVLHFWSLRCAACFKEVPELNLIAEEYHKKGVVIISMMDDTRDALKEKIGSAGEFYRLRKPVFGNDKIGFEIIPDAKETMMTYKPEDIPFGFPITYFIKGGLVKEFSFGYMMSYGNPQPAESKNYFHIKKVLDRLIADE
ncbi:MAG: TlpA family protein disulfide reductase, partial [Bacteroidota bacterium]|nr:TlpA family protein disulfide reductase [Bacteroidota bacterium]